MGEPIICPNCGYEYMSPSRIEGLLVCPDCGDELDPNYNMLPDEAYIEVLDYEGDEPPFSTGREYWE